MEDKTIVDMYWDRNEEAIVQSDIKYGRMLNLLSYSLTDSREDAQECVNDTYAAAWASMPTARPNHLGAFLSKITRRISINRFREKHRQKRGADELVMELTDCITSSETVEGAVNGERLKDILDRFLYALPISKRSMFIRRYFYSHSIEKIAADMDMSRANVKTTLYRIRRKLAKILEEEGLI